MKTIICVNGECVCFSLDKDKNIQLEKSFFLDFERRLLLFRNSQMQQPRLFGKCLWFFLKCDWVSKKGAQWRKQAWVRVEKCVSSPCVCVCVCVSTNLIPYHDKKNELHLVLITERVYTEEQSGNHQAVCAKVCAWASFHPLCS